MQKKVDLMKLLIFYQKDQSKQIKKELKKQQIKKMKLTG